MAFVGDDVADDKRFLKRKFDTIEKHGQSEDPSVRFLMKKRRAYDFSHADADYVMYLNNHLFTPCDTHNQLSCEDGDDPQYALFLSRLKKDGSSYILEADERIGLAKPLKYEEDESCDVQEDMISPSKTQGSEGFDEDYEFFSKNLRFHGPNLIFQYDSGPPVVYFSRKQMSNLSLPKEKSSCSSEEDRYSWHGEQKKKKLSKFRVRIMKILSKPYDKEEHQKLFQDITAQTPQHRHVELRSGCGAVRFTTSNKMGKSYLEHYGNLKRKVYSAAKDACKQLNLLRGFFFWIQNLTQDGSFMPWNDEECLAVRPEGC